MVNDVIRLFHGGTTPVQRSVRPAGRPKYLLKDIFSSTCIFRTCTKKYATMLPLLRNEMLRYGPLKRLLSKR